MRENSSGASRKRLSGRENSPGYRTPALLFGTLDDFAGGASTSPPGLAHTREARAPPLQVLRALNHGLLCSPRPFCWLDRARNRRHGSFTRRAQLKTHAHFVVADDHRLKRIKPPGRHVASRYISDKFRAFAGIDNDIALCLGERLVIGPLHQLFPARIAKDKIILPAIAENKVHRFP